AETLVHITGKARLPVLAVADDVHSGLDLLVHNFLHGAAHTCGEFLLVIGLAIFFRPHELYEPWRTHQAADMSGENPVCTPLHGLPPDGMLQHVCCGVLYSLATRGGSMVNWHDLATTSHYQTAVAIKHALSAGDVEHARIGIEELIEAL